MTRRVVTVGEHRVADASGPAGGDQADGGFLGDSLAMEEVEGHRDDLGLELGGARTDIPLERVHVPEETERFVQEVVMIVISAVHGP